MKHHPSKVTLLQCRGVRDTATSDWPRVFFFRETIFQDLPSYSCGLVVGSRAACQRSSFCCRVTWSCTRTNYQVLIRMAAWPQYSEAQKLPFCNVPHVLHWVSRVWWPRWSAARALPNTGGNVVRMGDENSWETWESPCVKWLTWAMVGQ